MSTAQVNFTQAPTGPEAPTTDPTKDINATATNGATDTGGGADPARPEWLPAQFNSGEDLARSFTDTRAELTRAQQELAKLRKTGTGSKPDGTAGAGEPEATTPEGAAQQVVNNAGLDVSAWQQEFNETMDVSEDGRAAIAKGLEAQFGANARAIVDDFIEGAKARATNAANAIFEQVGGKDQYQQMVGWAAANLSDAEVAAYNNAMGSHDINVKSLAVEGLRAKFTRANGSNPNLISGDSGIPNSQAGFASTFEMTKAMGDPRYGKDPAYTKQVEQRAQRSNF